MAAAAATSAAAATRAWAFGEEGAFNPRVLLTGSSKWQGKRRSAPARWSYELVRRTSAPARLSPTVVRADSPKLLAEPFAIWSGAKAPDPLTRSELRGLRRFIGLGGVLLVDEQQPKVGAFLKGARQQIARVVPHGSPIKLAPKNVIFRSFYLLAEATGRLHHEPKLLALVRGGFAVNIAMYVLCSNYKDDQVHAPFLMRRRASGRR